MFQNFILNAGVSANEINNKIANTANKSMKVVISEKSKQPCWICTKNIPNDPGLMIAQTTAVKRKARRIPPTLINQYFHVARPIFLVT